MTKDVLYESLEKLAVHFGAVSIQEKEDYYTHLKGYTDAEMAQAAFVIIDSRKWKSYPRVAEVRTVLDKIRFDNRSGPTDAERDAYYDGLTCGCATAPDSSSSRRKAGPRGLRSVARAGSGASGRTGYAATWTGSGCGIKSITKDGMSRSKRSGSK